jgi:O-antigen ligase
MKDKLLIIGNKLIILSTFLFAISIPTSIALDGISAGIGLLGLMIVLLFKDFENLPPMKPIILLLIPEILSSLVFFPKEVLKTDFNHKLTPYFVVYRTLKQDRSSLKKLIFVLSISSFILSLSVIFQAFTWQNVKYIDIHSLSFHLTPMRAMGLLDNPLTTAGVIFLLFFLFLGYFLQNKSYYCLFISIFLFISLILTESRSYWIGIIASCLILSILLFKRYWKFLITFWGIVVISTTVLFQIPNLKDRLYSITNTRTNWSNVDRLILWKSHIKAFICDYSPLEKLIGAGYKASDYAWKRFPESYKEVVKTETPKNLKVHFHGGLTHNIYLKFLTKYGILGLIGYLSFWFLIFKENLKILRTNPQLLPIISSLISCYFGFLVAGFFENNFTDSEIKYAVMFILGLNFFIVNHKVSLLDK